MRFHGLVLHHSPLSNLDILLWTKSEFLESEIKGISVMLSFFTETALFTAMRLLDKK